MRPNLVVVASPAFNKDLGFPQGIEDFSVEQFIPQPAIETLVIAVLPGAARFYKECLDPEPLKPVPDRYGSEIRTIGNQ